MLQPFILALFAGLLFVFELVRHRCKAHRAVALCFPSTIRILLIFQLSKAFRQVDSR